MKNIHVDICIHALRNAYMHIHIHIDGVLVLNFETVQNEHTYTAEVRPGSLGPCKTKSIHMVLGTRSELGSVGFGSYRQKGDHG